MLELILDYMGQQLNAIEIHWLVELTNDYVLFVHQLWHLYMILMTLVALDIYDTVVAVYIALITCD